MVRLPGPPVCTRNCITPHFDRSLILLLDAELGLEILGTKFVNTVEAICSYQEIVFNYALVLV